MHLSYKLSLCSIEHRIFSFRKTRKFKDAVHLAYEMEKLKTKPSLLQLTKTLRRKEETRPTSK